MIELLIAIGLTFVWFASYSHEKGLFKWTTLACTLSIWVLAAAQFLPFFNDGVGRDFALLALAVLGVGILASVILKFSGRKNDK